MRRQCTAGFFFFSTALSGTDFPQVNRGRGGRSPAFLILLEMLSSGYERNLDREASSDRAERPDGKKTITAGGKEVKERKKEKEDKRSSFEQRRADDPSKVVDMQ